MPRSCFPASRFSSPPSIRVGDRRHQSIFSSSEYPSTASPRGRSTPPDTTVFLRATPQTITVLDLIHLQSPVAAKYRPYYDLFLKPLLKRNKHVLTISDTSKAHIERWLDDSGVAVINAGMGSSPEFTLDGPSHVAERPYFLYVGNLRSHKNDGHHRAGDDFDRGSRSLHRLL